MRVVAALPDVVLVGEDDRRAAVTEVELGEHTAEMGLQRGLTPPPLPAFVAARFAIALRSIARFLPLEPLANGYQSQYVTDSSGVGLDAGNLGVLAAWALVAIALVAQCGFRWQPQQRR